MSASVDLIAVGLTLACIMLALGCWLGYQFLLQNGRLLLRVEALEQAVQALARGEQAETAGQPGPPASNGSVQVRDLVTRAPRRRRVRRYGLVAGTPAPSFRLPRLDGGELSLGAYRGRQVLLIFSDPACRPWNALAPELEWLHRDVRDLQVLVVSRGDPEANRAQVAEHGLTFPIVLQRHWEVSRDYGMIATPIGYLIDQQGVVAADVAVGAEAILALAAEAPEVRTPRRGASLPGRRGRTS